MTGEPATKSGPGARRPGRHRPTVAVVIVAVFLFIQAALYLFLGVFLVLAALGTSGDGVNAPALVVGNSLTTAGHEFLLGGLFSASGLVALAILIGFMLRLRWAWVGAITWVAVSLGVGLLAYFQGHPSYTTLIINVVLVIALNQTSLERQFGGKELRRDG